MPDDNRISDEALVSAMAAGDQDSLATLNHRYGRALCAVADRILRDKADAEEVAADVLWQLWREASRFAERISIPLRLRDTLRGNVE